jgi:3-keto-disaccharide hydrolase
MKTSTPEKGTYSPVKLGVIGLGLGLGLALGVGAINYFSTPVAAHIAASPVYASAPEQTESHGAPGKQAHRSSPFREPDPIDFNNHAGYVQIFDGHDLKNWVGDRSVWRAEDGAIVGESTREKPVDHSYISFHGFEVKNFDLKLEIKVVNGGGSGIQYRSKTGIPWRTLRPGQPQPNLKWMMTGPQADFWFPVNPTAAQYTGQFYSENTGLGILAWRGEVVESVPGTRPRLVGTIGDRSALGGYVKVNAWNQYMIMARGGTFIHVINGQLMAMYQDDDPKSSNNQPGLIGIELESTPCKVSVRDIWVKRL